VLLEKELLGCRLGRSKLLVNRDKQEKSIKHFFIINPLSAKLIFQGQVQGHFQGQVQGRSQGQGQSLDEGHVQGHGRG